MISYGEVHVDKIIKNHVSFCVAQCPLQKRHIGLYEKTEHCPMIKGDLFCDAIGLDDLQSCADSTTELLLRDILIQPLINYELHYSKLIEYAGSMLLAFKWCFRSLEITIMIRNGSNKFLSRRERNAALLIILSNKWLLTA